MQTSEKFLYHSFPRPQNGHSDDQKALKILESIFQSGLLLTPEIYKFSEELNDGSGGPEKIVVQNRLCFTQIGEDELSNHAKFFGNVSLEFEVSQLQQAHVCPVFYLPQDSKDLIWRGAFGSLLSRLAETHQLLERLQKFFEYSSNHSNSEEFLILTNKGDSFPTDIKIKDLHFLLSMLNDGSQPFSEQLGAIKGLSNLFYPIENTKYTDKLGYYMQREWRMISNIKYRNKSLVNDLTTEEKDRLLELDKKYFDKEVIIPTGTFKRIDLCRFLRTINGKPITELIKRIFVPNSILSETRDLLKKYDLEIELCTSH
ncbi:hypothetical protein CPT03_07040 [Pedobacter ginsengisoli]|uniref:Uncharacterized protein n=1 Tax=Pedobacter ginsengisoli TaxID=363852 RepID=A0A2D1U3N6_9SPHI|nr:abortive infection system antitoxin AbiGi family protein [Pedobacter ginsengisoli]ATP56240.1 hypothetical protein CPT03_07040 [Pedobacter ginsengisoli]